MQDRPLRVMVVDDDKSVVDMFRDLFTEFLRGDVVSAARDGHDAVSKYAELKPGPDVVLMDERMPRMDGLDATKRILEIDSSARIVFISADSTVEKRAMDAGARCFIQKPFRIEDLKTSIEKVLEDAGT